MTGFIAYVFLYPSRVSFIEAFEALEPDDGKPSRPVLRGLTPSNGGGLLGGPQQWGPATRSVTRASKPIRRATLRTVMV
jgi:hypothetical protein